jgi:murein DD-endopeptidase MepM/ murein hydrolase activator NlpD
MRNLPSALLRLASGATLFVMLGATTVTPSFAFGALRPMADDVSIDQYLAGPPAPSAPASVEETNVEAAAEAEPEPELEIATIGGPAMRPLRTTFEPVAPAKGIITTYFGEVGPLSPRGHAGIDVAAPMGTPILAMDDGEVMRSDFAHGAYGGLVIVAHASGYETWYAHLSRLSVEPGDQVTRGEQVGRMGSTGMSTGSHLHFEVRQDGALVNPFKWLREADLER